MLVPAVAAVVVAAAVAGLLVCRGVTPHATAPVNEEGTMVELPAPDTDGTMTIEQALERRRSHRRFSERALSLEQVGQLLWAAQGCTTDKCMRTAPSAGATYPLEVFAVTGEGTVMGLDAGVYHYSPPSHGLEPVAGGDLRSELASAALGQSMIASAPATIVIAADYSRTARTYGQRATRYVHMEAGHAAQNVYLQAEPLELGTVVVGAFRDAEVESTLAMPDDLAALYLMPVGEPTD
jgi:SagB-type dehydrogenase family enzyme